jgi:hypothetical protein
MTNMRNPNVGQKVGVGTTLGPASYSNAARPTIVVNGLRVIDSVNDVVVFCNDSGYECSVVSVSGNVVTFKVRTPLGAHLHNLKFKDADVAPDAAGTRVNVGTDKIGANAGTDITVTSTDGTRGVQNSTAAQATEVANVTALNTLTFTAQAYGK